MEPRRAGFLFLAGFRLGFGLALRAAPACMPGSSSSVSVSVAVDSTSALSAFFRPRPSRGSPRSSMLYVELCCCIAPKPHSLSSLWASSEPLPAPPSPAPVFVAYALVWLRSDATASVRASAIDSRVSGITAKRSTLLNRSVASNSAVTSEADAMPRMCLRNAKTRVWMISFAASSPLPSSSLMLSYPSLSSARPWRGCVRERSVCRVASMSRASMSVPDEKTAVPVRLEPRAFFRPGAASNGSRCEPSPPMATMSTVLEKLREIFWRCSRRRRVATSRAMDSSLAMSMTATSWSASDAAARCACSSVNEKPCHCCSSLRRSGNGPLNSV
mmetsp:Transcript_44791/g.138168  ORF Transcript_44791/g.138168 Transcript_44791/m.138168 type:complete len:330 (-) Transcript_44791:216-1205(-)